jgi:hypothetical protein
VDSFPDKSLNLLLYKVDPFCGSALPSSGHPAFFVEREEVPSPFLLLDQNAVVIPLEKWLDFLQKFGFNFQALSCVSLLSLHHQSVNLVLIPLFLFMSFLLLGCLGRNKLLLVFLQIPQRLQF